MKKIVYSSWIEVICGPMFSGKTDELLNRLNKIKYAKEKYIIFKPVIDTRTSGIIQSRTKKWEKAIEISHPKEIIQFLENSDEKYKVIAIDEAQFFSHELVDICMKLSKDKYHIIISGLDKNFKGEPFGSTMPGLLAIADSVKKLSAACNICGAHATFSKLIDDQEIKVKKDILIGDDDYYEARCYEHHSFKK
ncbi:MAG: thymidine kinase [Ureaplasma sp.]|nr:thymidine kinase [Ureaplasma sp.]